MASFFFFPSSRLSLAQHNFCFPFFVYPSFQKRVCTFHSPPPTAHQTLNKMTSDPATEPKLDEFVGDAEAGDDDDDLDSLGESVFVFFV